ncbi:hypothetical protein FNH05_04995 [Amycolatopsis rhizosphaerae]|uniref:LamG-like jellyroll fold domain-containing protein n=1 Tax=Amycolatopsis rhizosphaerae TaxID=2053003 RepID=A0A558DGF0_9PSEU|nr:LamG-like jellyroll fold domain-containing protein [Amycolatopsis rhizosphaerae]TVT60099.1 hypothetical protein FNH05_04995 [Amycolatopsis rhizosphaerae]
MTGKPVEVVADATETRQVVANPDGTFTLNATARPTRVNRNNQWVPVDATLHQTSDGRLAPANTTQNVSFSAGGTSPLVTVALNNTTLSFSWPTPLPTPVVSGATATYPNVLSGVDLTVTAAADHYSEVLVVHDRQAASNPALSDVRLKAQAMGLTVNGDGQGGLVAVDNTGKPVFGGPEPAMWDSHLNPTMGATPSATDPSTGTLTALPASVTQQTSDAATGQSNAEVSISPTAAALTGPNVTYPVYIDPQINCSVTSCPGYWNEVTANGWWYSPTSPAQIPYAQVGYCYPTGDCNGMTVARSFFRFDTTAIAARPNGTTATVFGSWMFANEVWSANGCTTEPVDVGLAGPIDDNTRWPGPAWNFTDRQFSAAGANCGQPGNVVFTVTGNAQQAANNAWPNLTLGLRADNENDQMQWKKFDENPQLTVNFSYPPNTPYNLNVSRGVTCTGVAYTSDSKPTMYASASDNNNPPLNLVEHFTLLDQNGQQVSAGDTPPIGSGTVGAFTDPVPLTQQGYQFRVYASTSDQYSSMGSPGAFYNFTYLPPPTQQPSANSQDYPQNYWGEPTTAPGALTLIAGGAGNIAGFTWTLQGSGSEPAPPINECNYNQTFTDSGGHSTGGYVGIGPDGTSTLRMPANLSVGYHTIYLRSFDLAHNLSPESKPYVLYVAPATSAGAVPSDVAATTLAVSQPSGQNIPLGPQADCCGVSWFGGKQLWFQSAAANTSFTETFTIPSGGDAAYQLGANMTVAPDYGIITATLDSTTPLPINGLTQFDGYNAGVAATRFASFGTTYLTAGTHTLTFTVAGTNSASVGNRYMVGTDRLHLRPTNQRDAFSPAVQSTTLGGPATVIQPNSSGQTWRDGAQLLFPATAAGQAVKLTFTVPVEADYALGITLTQAPNYGQLAFNLDGATPLDNTSPSSPYDTYSATVNSTYLPLWGGHLQPGSHSVTVSVTGKNGSSTGYAAGIQLLTVAAVNNVTAATFAAAMNNHGIVNDNVNSNGNLDTVGGYALSAQSMANAGITPGQNYTVGGAAFSIPPAGNASTPDNVVAFGQTIPFPQDQQVNASAVGLLVAATCGPTPAAPASISYLDGPTSNPVVPSVPDWIYGDPASATVVPKYIVTAMATPVPQRSGQIYAIFLPADPHKKLKSITLPYLGGTARNTCAQGSNQTPALHVLAIAPRVLSAQQGWLGAWAAPADASTAPPGNSFNNQTIRMVVHPTATGTQTRVRLSNTNATVPVTIDTATVAAQAGTTGTGAVAMSSPVSLLPVGGITIPAGGEIYTNAVTMPSLTGGSGNLLVSLHVQTAGGQVPFHNSTTPTYLASGDATGNVDGSAYPTSIAGDYYATGLDVSTSSLSAGTIAVFGDNTSLATATGGSCNAGTYYACTWVDDLASGSVASLKGNTIINASRAGTPAQHRWALGDGSGTTAADTGANAGLPATASGPVGWNTGPVGSSPGSASFNGSTTYLSTSGPALDTWRSFTVSAWVKPTTLGSSWQTYVVQQATHASGFYLEYDGTSGKWSFSQSDTDSVNPVNYRAESANAAQAGVWTHLTGTYNASNGQMQLWVNGALSGQATNLHTNTLDARGPLVIGRGYFNDTPGNFANASIADVRVYQRALNMPDTLALSATPTIPAGAPTAYTAGNCPTTCNQLPISPNTTLNQTVLNEPDVQTVIISLGANDLLDGQSASQIENSLNQLINLDKSFAFMNYFRQDSSLLKVFVTTVPPLGLSDTDPREQNRKSLNAYIANFGFSAANGYIDFDSAITTSPNVVNPTYLTNGAPNAAYYNQLATTATNPSGDTLN